MKQSNEPIDFVIAWVDGNDQKWKREKEWYARRDGKQLLCDDRDERYRDWDNLQYWFRGVEKNAPWVHKIYFVTCGHLPKWLDTSNPKLVIVNHKDYIPEEYLPTYNANVIELNFHRIPGLSEHFVYFNDDVFLLKQVMPQDFFVNGKPKDMLALQPDVANTENDVMPYIYLNNAMMLAKYFRKRENIRKQPLKYFHVGYPFLYFCYNFLELAFPLFTGFYTVHGPSPLCKSTYETIWDKEPELLDRTCQHKFRSREDVNQYILREWQKLTGNFVPKNIGKYLRYFNVDNQNVKLTKCIQKRKCKAVCINDSNQKIDFDRAREQLQKAFENIFPEKSSFEK